VTVALAAVFLVAVFSGATAAVAGFGIGSVVTSPWPAVAVAVATAGVLVGTLIGERVLPGLTPHVFRRVVGAVVLVIGIVVPGRGPVR
jgi:uncharacterized membrane protein YfcA